MKLIPILKVFPNKNFKGKICLSPYKSLAIDINGGAWLCLCENWGTQYIGNILNTKLEDLLSSSSAVEIRKSISDGNYRHCNELTCGVIQYNELLDFENLSEADKKLISDPTNYEIPSDIFLSLDRTCNLSCPSCRVEIIKSSEDQIDSQNKIGEILYQNLFSTPTDKVISLRLSSSGEVFASPMLIRFLEKITVENFPNLELWFQTNGLLAPSKWHHIEHLEKNIKNVTVTIDAAQADTYEKLRRGGKWLNLNKAMEFLNHKKKSCDFNLHSKMVVQQDNFLEMNDFYNFSKQYNVDIVEYTRITNWGTYNDQDFAEIDIFSKSHANYTKAKKILEELISLPDVRAYGGL